MPSVSASRTPRSPRAPRKAASKRPGPLPFAVPQDLDEREIARQFDEGPFPTHQYTFPSQMRPAPNEWVTCYKGFPYRSDGTPGDGAYELYLHADQQPAFENLTRLSCGLVHVVPGQAPVLVAMAFGTHINASNRTLGRLCQDFDEKSEDLFAVAEWIEEELAYELGVNELHEYTACRSKNPPFTWSARTTEHIGLCVLDVLVHPEFADRNVGTIVLEALSVVTRNASTCEYSTQAQKCRMMLEVAPANLVVLPSYNEASGSLYASLEGLRTIDPDRTKKARGGKSVLRPQHVLQVVSFDIVEFVSSPVKQTLQK